MWNNYQKLAHEGEHLRSFLRGWAKHLSGVYKVEKERLLNLIHSLDVKAETTVLPAAELHTKLDAEMRLKELLRERRIKVGSAGKSLKSGPGGREHSILPHDRQWQA